MPHTRYTPLPAFQFNPILLGIDRVRERKAERKGGKEREGRGRGEEGGRRRRWRERERERVRDQPHTLYMYMYIVCVVYCLLADII